MTTQDEVRSTLLLRELLNGLLRNYPDAQWDATTRLCLEEANAHLGGEPIVWDLPAADEERHDATGQ
jgi:hypothetical protein